MSWKPDASVRRVRYAVGDRHSDSSCRARSVIDVILLVAAPARSSQLRDDAAETCSPQAPSPTRCAYVGARGNPCAERSGQGRLDLAEIDHGLPILQAAVRESAGKIWAQEVPVNNAIPVGKHPRFMPNGTYALLETTLVQINAWLLR